MVNKDSKEVQENRVIKDLKEPQVQLELQVSRGVLV